MTKLMKCQKLKSEMNKDSSCDEEFQDDPSGILTHDNPTFADYLVDDNVSLEEFERIFDITTLVGKLIIKVKLLKLIFF